MANVRRSAVSALIKQEQNGYSNLVLNAALNSFDGTDAERAQLSALFYGVTERLITLDFFLQKNITKPIEKLDAQIRAILRVGAYQVLFSKVPHALVVNESVILTRKMKKSSAAGMVNAVLRKLSVMPHDIENNYKFSEEIERLHVQYSVSKPIIKLLCEHYPTLYKDILKQSFEKPKLCIRANTLQTNAKELMQIYDKQGVVSQLGDVNESLYVEYKGDITKTKLFKRGAFHVQSETSQFVCFALNAKKGEKVLDLCAAPGGKSATIAQYMQNSGTLFSFDNAKNRLSLIESIFERMNIDCAQILHGNAAIYNEICLNADKILCDVPCSGLGILAKKPDIRYKTLLDIESLIQLQAKILQNAAKYLKKGGYLIYSTCTINPNENENIVDEFLKNNSDFKACDLNFTAQNAIIKNNYITFLPLTNKQDGFFVALLQKI